MHANADERGERKTEQGKLVRAPRKSFLLACAGLVLGLLIIASAFLTRRYTIHKSVPPTSVQGSEDLLIQRVQDIVSGISQDIADLTKPVIASLSFCRVSVGMDMPSTKRITAGEPLSFAVSNIRIDAVKCQDAKEEKGTRAAALEELNSDRLRMSLELVGGEAMPKEVVVRNKRAQWLIMAKSDTVNRLMGAIEIKGGLLGTDYVPSSDSPVTLAISRALMTQDHLLLLLQVVVGPVLTLPALVLLFKRLLKSLRATPASPNEEAISSPS